MAASESIVVFGAGAVGGYLGGKLAYASAANRVTLLGRPRVVDVIREKGLVVREGKAETIVHPDTATSAGEIGRADLVLLTVRAYDLEGAIPDLHGLLDRHSLVVALQNGVGSEERLAEALGRDRVLAGTLTTSVAMDETGTVTRLSRGGGVAVAAMGATPVPGWVVDAFRGAGLPSILLNDYRSLRWSKLLLNMLGAATSAILDVDMNVLMSKPALFRVEQLAVREAGRVMDAQGIATVALPGYPVPLVRRAMRLPRPLAQRLLGPRIAQARGGHSPTMRADMARGRSEVQYYNGAISAAAERTNVPAPVNAGLAELTLDLLHHPERRMDFHGRPDRLIAFLRTRGARL